MLMPYLFIDATEDKGRGVFTSESIPAGTIVEASPVIIMEKADRQHLDKTLLHDYIFEWGEPADKCCMALGWIPIYNHSYASNCDYIMDYEADAILIKTMRHIEAGEELTINYNGEWNDETRVWFETK